MPGAGWATLWVGRVGMTTSYHCDLSAPGTDGPEHVTLKSPLGSYHSYPVRVCDDDTGRRLKRQKEEKRHFIPGSSS